MDELIQRGQTTEQVVLLQGDIHLAREDFVAAQKQFRSLADEGSRPGAIRLISLLIQQEEYADAASVADSFLAKNDQDALMKSLRATAMVHMGDIAAAKKQYEAMMPSSDPVVLNNLAWIYMREGNPRALEIAERANTLSPDNADIEDTLGWILVQNDRVTEGLRYLQSSASNRPDNASVQYHLGVAYQLTGQNERAARALRRAVDIGGFEELEDAKSALSEIESQT